MKMKISNYIFDGPFDHNKVFNRDFGAVYAILDMRNIVVDVGETSSVNSRLPNHDRKECWNRNGGISLYVLNTPIESDRLRIESEIRGLYAPVCGIK